MAKALVTAVKQALSVRSMRGGLLIWLVIGLAVACLLGCFIGESMLDWLLTPGKLADLVFR